jgi:hypothetical protein
VTWPLIVGAAPSLKVNVGEVLPVVVTNGSNNFDLDQTGRFAGADNGFVCSRLKARKGGSQMFFFQEGFTYRNFLMDVLGIFIFVVWFWLLITVFADLFRRHDISGWIKAIWVIALIVFSYIAVLAYLIFQGRGMAERNVQQAQQARDELRRVVGFSVADEIQKLGGLKKAGSISDAEFARLRARLVSGEALAA